MLEKILRKLASRNLRKCLTAVFYFYQRLFSVMLLEHHLQNWKYSNLRIMDLRVILCYAEMLHYRKEAQLLSCVSAKFNGVS